MEWLNIFSMFLFGLFVIRWGMNSRAARLDNLDVFFLSLGLVLRVVIILDQYQRIATLAEEAPYPTASEVPELWAP